MKKSRKRFFLLANLTFTVIVVAVIASVYCGYIAYLYKSRMHARFTAGSSVQGDWPITGDSQIGYISAPNCSTFFNYERSQIAFHLFTDNRGFRVSSLGEQTPDIVEIVTIGGSFPWGYGVENQNTFTAKLGKRLDVGVANLAYGGYGTVQALQTLKKHANLKPKFIIYTFIKDHLRRNLSSCAPGFPPFCVPVARINFNENGAPFLQPPHDVYNANFSIAFRDEFMKNDAGFESIIWGAKIIKSRVEQKFIRNHPKDTTASEGAIRFLLQEMRREANQLNATLLVLHIPYLSRNSTNAAASEFLRALPDDLLFIDLAPVVEAYYENPDNPSLRFEYDGHPNEIAHELIADRIYAALKIRIDDFQRVTRKN